MTVEFVDPNILVYAVDADSETKFNIAVELIARLADEGAAGSPH
jgi:predicted nucleic acid-binding protein